MFGDLSDEVSDEDVSDISRKMVYQQPGEISAPALGRMLGEIPPMRSAEPPSGFRTTPNPPGLQDLSKLG